MSDDKKAAVRAVETGERKDRVLIVEDEENARKRLRTALQRWGCEVLGVGTAEDALAKFGGFQPDALIADVELPGMNGLDLLKQLGPELTDVPTVIITGKGSESAQWQRLRQGAPATSAATAALSASFSRMITVGTSVSSAQVASTGPARSCRAIRRRRSAHPLNPPNFASASSAVPTPSTSQPHRCKSCS